MTSKSYYVLVASQQWDEEECAIPAESVANDRLRKGFWPLFVRTPNRLRILPGDGCVIYLAGTGKVSKCISAIARVQSVENWRPEFLCVSDSSLRYAPLATAIKFENIRFYEPPLKMHTLLDRLEFIGGRKDWGVMLQGGCRKIPEQDFRLIEQESST